MAGGEVTGVLEDAAAIKIVELRFEPRIRSTPG
jgi:hypothetical protein